MSVCVRVCKREREEGGSQEKTWDQSDELLEFVFFAQEM